MKLISATPSPYARKVRIALVEKQIPFELSTEVPWDSTTTVPQYNPLEKLPILILDDGTSVYESYYILEYIEANFSETPLIPSDPKEALKHKQVQVVSDGVCDACVLRFFEVQRGEGKISKEWLARQMRKVEGGVKWLDQTLRDNQTKHGSNDDESFMVGDKFGIADVAAGSVLGYLSVRFTDFDWKTKYPALEKYWSRLETRPSFKDTVPYPQKISDKIV